MVRNAPLPSSSAAMPALWDEQKKRPVLNGRPDNNFGPPIGLFHPVFNSFQAALKIPEPTYADAQTYNSVKELFCAVTAIYNNKADRIVAIDKHLSTLLGTHFIDVYSTGVLSDGVMVHSTGICTAYLVIREVKNEIGTTSADPYNQVGLAYRKYWAHPSNDRIRKLCYCPSILLAIAGPWMCVIGAIYLDKAVIQPLTDYIWLGGDVYDDNRLVLTARLFAALKAAASTLQSYYQILGPTLLNDVPENLSPDPFPFVTECGSKKFTYLYRLFAREHPEKLLYGARLQGEERLVVVKFASSYHAEAHRILADHQLAPTLHFAGTEDAGGSMYGGRYMIVMDFIDGCSAPDRLSNSQFNQIKEAIELLHSRNLVFGDLREPNILVQDGSVKLIDFDWCGTAGEARYPPSLNLDPALGWHKEVKPDAVIMKEHDLYMLEVLRDH